MIKFQLTWPPRVLSPNARVHWGSRARIAKKYRHDARLVALAALRNHDLAELQEAKVLHLWLEFHPPDRRRRDDDNVFGSFKAGRDGIADALQVDDHLFRMHPVLLREPVKHGRVDVTLTTQERRYGL